MHDVHYEAVVTLECTEEQTYDAPESQANNSLQPMRGDKTSSPQVLPSVNPSPFTNAHEYAEVMIRYHAFPRLGTQMPNKAWDAAITKVAIDELQHMEYQLQSDVIDQQRLIRETRIK